MFTQKRVTGLKSKFILRHFYKTWHFSWFPVRWLSEQVNSAWSKFLSIRSLLLISKPVMKNSELNDLRKNCLRKSEVSVERIPVCKVIENLVEHGIHCLSCSYTNDVIDMLL